MISADWGDAGGDLFVPRVRHMPFDIPGSPHIVRVFTRISALVSPGQVGYEEIKFVVFDYQECLLSDLSAVFGPHLFPELDQLPTSWIRSVSCSFKYRHRDEATTAREIMQDGDTFQCFDVFGKIPGHTMISFHLGNVFRGDLRTNLCSLQHQA